MPVSHNVNEIYKRNVENKLRADILQFTTISSWNDWINAWMNANAMKHWSKGHKVIFSTSNKNHFKCKGKNRIPTSIQKTIRSQCKMLVVNSFHLFLLQFLLFAIQPYVLFHLETEWKRPKTKKNITTTHNNFLLKHFSFREWWKRDKKKRCDFLQHSRFVYSILRNCSWLENINCLPSIDMEAFYGFVVVVFNGILCSISIE